MRALIQTIAVARKELRELLRRPVLVLTLIVGPLVIMLTFGIGSDAQANPPRTIVVLPPGQDEPQLLRNYEREFQEFLNVTGYTQDEEYAREQLRRNRVDAVVILPLRPYETIAGGEQAQIQLLYNEINPSRRWLIPDFVGILAGNINREIFLENASEQRTAVRGVSEELDLAIAALDRAIAAAERGDEAETRRQLQLAQTRSARAEAGLAQLGPEADPLRAAADRSQDRLQEEDLEIEATPQTDATPGAAPLVERLGLRQARRDLVQLRTALNQFTSVPPEVAIAPLEVQSEYVAEVRPDVIGFFAPAILALLVQHTAVSLGALALVRERLAGTFDLYKVAPTSSLQLLIGKYVAYVFFSLAISAILVVVLVTALDVPLFGSVWRLSMTLVLLALSSVGLGLALSLLAISERQAVQFAMLALLAIVFFSGIALPLDALRMPALLLSYSLPATYGVSVLQDVMLRGLPGSNTFLLILAAMAIALFVFCLGLLFWRTRPV